MVAPATLVVESAANQILAGAAFALHEQSCGARLGQALNHLQHVANGFRPPDDILQTEAGCVGVRDWSN